MTTEVVVAAASLAVGAVALAVGIVAAFVSLYAAFKGNINASAGTFISFVVGFGDSWRRFVDANDDDHRVFEFGQLTNLLEAGCAIYLNRAIHGKSRELLEDHLEKVIRIIEGNDWCRNQIAHLKDDDGTFKHMRLFMETMRERKRLSILYQIVQGMDPG